MLQMQEQGAVSNQHILGRATMQWQRGRKNRPKTRDPARTGHGEADSRHPIQQGPKRVAVKTTNARSPRPEPTQSLGSGVVVDAEVLRDPADASTATGPAVPGLGGPAGVLPDLVVLHPHDGPSAGPERRVRSRGRLPSASRASRLHPEGTVGVAPPAGHLGSGAEHLGPTR